MTPSCRIATASRSRRSAPTNSTRLARRRPNASACRGCRSPWSPPGCQARPRPGRRDRRRRGPPFLRHPVLRQHSLGHRADHRRRRPSPLAPPGRTAPQAGVNALAARQQSCRKAEELNRRVIHKPLFQHKIFGHPGSGIIETVPPRSFGRRRVNQVFLTLRSAHYFEQILTRSHFNRTSL